MKPKTVRALDRGLAILRRLDADGGASLHELHQSLALPKPTLLRLLATLTDSGFVWQGLSDGRYHASHGVLDRNGGRPDALAEVAGPVLDWLVSKVQWPSDLSIRNGRFMQLCETSRMRSYFHLHRLAVGFRINMVLSAPGRAYLAFCHERERKVILGQLRKSKDPGLSQIGGERALEKIIEETRAQNFAIRDSHWGGHFSEPKANYDDGLMAIAVPITVDGRALACINLVWIGKLFKPAYIVKNHLADLQEAASLIGIRYEASQSAAKSLSAIQTSANGAQRRIRVQNA